MNDRVYYYPDTNEIVIAEFDPAIGWFIVHWEDAKQIYEPRYFKHFGFELLGEL